MKNRKFLLFCISVGLFFVLNCENKNKPPEYKITVTDIKFSDVWSGDDIGSSKWEFSFGTQIVYYRIKFKDPIPSDISCLRKIWKKNGSIFLEANAYVSSDEVNHPVQRICGELHYYNNTPMETGEYEILLKYWDSETQTFKDVEYADTVKRSFKIK